MTIATPTVGLALGGGGARGYSHIHALEAFDDLGIRPVAIAGTSIGAIIGSLYAAGLSSQDIREFAKERFRNRYRVMADLLRMKPENARRFLSEGGIRLGEINVERVLSVLLPGDIPNDFAQLDIPLKVVATDFHRQCQHVFQSGELLPALAASSAIPALFRPVLVNGEVYIDGGTTNPTPFDTLSGMADIIVAIDVSGLPRKKLGRHPRKVDVLTASSHIMQQSITRAKADQFRPDILLRAEVSGVRVHDFMRLQKVLDSSEPLRETLKNQLSAAIEDFTG